jgi:hypothetical protein
MSLSNEIDEAGLVERGWIREPDALELVLKKDGVILYKRPPGRAGWFKCSIEGYVFDGSIPKHKFVFFWDDLFKSDREVSDKDNQTG